MPFVMGTIEAVVFFVSAVCKVFYWLLIVRIILSWVGVNPYLHSNELLGAVFQASDFILRPFRRLPLQFGMIDFSPLLAIMLLHFLPGLVSVLLYSLVGAVHVR